MSQKLPSAAVVIGTLRVKPLVAATVVAVCSGAVILLLLVYCLPLIPSCVCGLFYGVCGLCVLSSSSS